MNSHTQHVTRATVLVCGLLMVLPSVVAAQGFRWWQDENARTKLGITSDQSRRIEEIFRSVRPELGRQKKALDAVELELSRLVESAEDDAAIALQVDRVEEARAELNKTRTLMLLRMRKVLTPEQRASLSSTHRELEREYRERSGRRDRRK